MRQMLAQPVASRKLQLAASPPTGRVADLTARRAPLPLPHILVEFHRMDRSGSALRIEDIA